MAGSEKDQWWHAMEAELSSIINNETWTLQPLPAGHNVIGCKWVYKRKISADGNVRYKARLVAKGFGQIRGVDYDDTYSQVVRFTTLHILFAFAVRAGLDVHHLDVEIAFLHGKLDETIYFQQPQGFVQKGKEDRVYLLHKALYGLKQRSRAWNRTIDDLLKKMNMVQSNFDSCVYNYIHQGKLIIATLFVDDFLVFTNSPDFFVTFKEGLTKHIPHQGPRHGKEVPWHKHQDKQKPGNHRTRSG